VGSKLVIGTSGWSYKDWEGSFYPPGLPAAEQLGHYAEKFGAVEVDATFYRIPTAQMVKNWYDRTPSGFLFTSKMPQLITTEKMLEDCREERDSYLSAISLLQEKLGCVLLQMPPQFKAEKADSLSRFLWDWPREIRLAVELRDRSWLSASTYDLLAQRNAAFCWVDHYYMPTSFPITADFGYVRWLGRRDKVTKFDSIQIDRSARLEEWAKTLAELLPKVNLVFGFFNNHYAGHSPASARQFLEMMSRRGGADAVS